MAVLHWLSVAAGGYGGHSPLLVVVLWAVQTHPKMSRVVCPGVVALRYLVHEGSLLMVYLSVVNQCLSIARGGHDARRT